MYGLKVDVKGKTPARDGISFLLGNHSGYELKAVPVDKLISLELCRNGRHIYRLDMSELYGQLTEEKILYLVYAEALTEIAKALKAFEPDIDGQWTEEELIAFYRRIKDINTNTAQTFKDITGQDVPAINVESPDESEENTPL